MKRSSILMAILALTTIVGAGLGVSSASHCNPSSGNSSRNAHDKFGSCEKNDGTVHCGNGQDAGGLATVIVKNDSGGTGVQGCAEDGSSFPLAGRVGAWVDGDGAHVFVDGGDSKNPSSAKGWQRYDVGPGGSCARRGTGGSYYTTGGGTSTADGFDVCT